MLLAARSLSAALLVLAGCRARPSTEARSFAPAAPDLLEAYHLDRPDTVLHLPEALREVSGLAWSPQGLVAIHDEQGDLYRFDGTSWRRSERFAGRGDFEGLAFAGRDLYVLRSDGQLVTPHGEVRLPTPTGCDGEGLAFDGRGGRLLVACKGTSPQTRALYAWDLASQRLDPEPVLRITANLGRTEGRLKRFLFINRIDRFRPSAVEVGPDGRLYVLSSEVQALAVFNREGQLEAAAGLDARALPQPEGLTFGPDGTLYISSEASKRGQAVVAVFKREGRGPTSTNDRR
ncbi:MAG TPA: SdiA-regulated domain-containing protein [Rhodothermales bacterium]|nr:SdiA-regulated domain-containing protein [Rhodothermales bacterium]